jgi:hypothetical protein
MLQQLQVLLYSYYDHLSNIVAQYSIFEIFKSWMFLIFSLSSAGLMALNLDDGAQANNANN